MYKSISTNLASVHYIMYNQKVIIVNISTMYRGKIYTKLPEPFWRYCKNIMMKPPYLGKGAQYTPTYNQTEFQKQLFQYRVVHLETSAFIEILNLLFRMHKVMTLSHQSHQITRRLSLKWGVSRSRKQFLLLHLKRRLWWYRQMEFDLRLFQKSLLTGPYESAAVL